MRKEVKMTWNYVMGYFTWKESVSLCRTGIVVGCCFRTGN